MSAPAFLLLLLAALCGPAAAQVFVGAEVGPDAFLGSEAAEGDTLSEEAFAWAMSAEVSSGTLYKVFASTAPEQAITGWLRKGLYRQELAALLLLSDEQGVPFDKLAKELEKKGGLAAVAAAHKTDALALFASAGRLKAAADARLPLFLGWAEQAPSTAAPAAVSTGTAPVK